MSAAEAGYGVAVSREGRDRWLVRIDAPVSQPCAPDRPKLLHAAKFFSADQNAEMM